MTKYYTRLEPRRVRRAKAKAARKPFIAMIPLHDNTFTPATLQPQRKKT